MARPSTALVHLLLSLALAALAWSCTSNGKPVTPREREEVEEEPPPTPAEIEAAVQKGLDASCNADPDCAMYLRCYASMCKVPPAMDGKAVGDGPVPAVAIVTSKGEAQFFMELARTAEERTRGLMFRPRMSDAWGMLFIYPGEKQLTFWMKNTFIPLDMVFISHDLHVVGVVENASPLTLDSRQVEGESQYVLELNAGLAARYGITKGDKVVFANLP